MTFCARHDPLPSVKDVVATQPELRTQFEERVKTGEYAALFDEQLTKVLREAAAALAQRGLVEEIGALRYVLARLLAEEKELSVLTASVTRVTSVAVQAARAQRAISGDVADGLTSALTQILTELDEG
jgi:hypothetical protein